MRSRFSTLSVSLAALAATLVPISGAAGGSVWHYTLGEVRENQQGNFCASADDVTELAAIFRKYGVRPGFAALSNSPNCETRVGSFTPHEIVEIIEVAKDKPNAYQIRFLRVEMLGGGRSYLITTRDVMPAGN